ncbi:MAG: T9SS type A sorting domain-containing protein [Bacteroidia bacterium]|nr:T9SS type A sorting domain-containing protein [Bacteroidia bacterium]
MNRFSLLILIIISSFSISHLGYSQTIKPIIADDLIIKQKIKENPQILNDYLLYEKNFKQIIENLNNIKVDTLINGRRIIPVVVHVIHANGPENISDAQVIDGINKMNIDYAKLNADTVNIFPLFKPRASDFAIEFRLAKIDVLGNCTNGIEHIFDPQTNWAYFATMKQYVWDPTKYMNIFAVNFIYPEGMSLPDGAFIGGMSPFPPDNTLSQALTGGDSDIDGVLIRQDCVGSIGTATDMGGMGINLLNRTFTHETGHYFNLYHPFQNLMFGLLPASSGCPTLFASAGDEVDDTPPVAVATQNTSVSCFTPGSINSCTQDSPDEPDMIENYMDYQFGYCTNSFTNGQKARVDATLAGIRHNLWTKENLIATGVLDTSYHPICAPIADFSATPKRICVGDAVNFSDISFNSAPTSWNWDLTGATPSTSTLQNPSVTYTAAGIYPVKLIVANASGNDSITKTSYIRVFDPSTNVQVPLNEDFEAGINPTWIVDNAAGIGWEITDTASVSGTKSARIRNFIGNQNGSFDDLISDGYDLTSLYNTVPLKLKFKYAYCGKINPGTVLTDADTAYDKMRILVSTNCGKTWAQKWAKLGAALQTTTVPNQNSFDPAPADWASDSINIHIYLNQHQTNFRFKFEFFGNGGNNIYLEDINIDNGTYTGMDSYSMDLVNMEVYPNPVDENSTISFDLPENMNTKIQIIDLVGKEIKAIENNDLAAGHHEYSISKNDLNSTGCYFVKLTAGEFVFTKKLMVK